MDDSNNSNIWKIITCVEDKRYTEAESLCELAKEECKYLDTKINVQHRKTVDHLKTFIASVERRQHQSSSKQLTSVKDEFMRVVVTYYKEKMRGETKSHRQTVRKPQRKDGESEATTETALKFLNVYDEMWPEAFDALEKQGLSQQDAAMFLLEIVQRAFTFNKDDAERQLTEAQRCAVYIVKFGQIPKEKSSGYIDDSHVADELWQYRYLLANQALPRAKQEFRIKHLEKVCKKYNHPQSVMGSKPIDDFASSCVEVTWYMCAEDPPTHMVIEKESAPFDNILYRACTREGKNIDYVLWPALRGYKDGPVIAKGVVECKN